LEKENADDQAYEKAGDAEELTEPAKKIVWVHLAVSIVNNR